MQNIFDFRTAPAINGLVVVAHGEQVTVHRGKIANDFVLHRVGVLELVHQNIAEPAAQILPRVFVIFQKQPRFIEQIVKIERVVFTQVFLITAVHLDDIVDLVFPCVFLGIAFGIKPQHFRIPDMIFNVFEQFFIIIITFLEGFFNDIIALRFTVNGEILRNPQFIGIHT